MKITEWNIRGAAGLPWEKDFNEEILTNLFPKSDGSDDSDIIVLCEYVNFLGSNQLYGVLKKKGYIWFEMGCTACNGILIIVKKDLIDIDNFKKNVYNNYLIFSNFRGCNCLRVRLPLLKGGTLSIIGCRMETGGPINNQYNLEKKIFDDILIPLVEQEMKKKIEKCIICGDFNNGKHYGAINQTFREVESYYYTQKYDKRTHRYFGPKIKRAQYNYNLHTIKDKFLDLGFSMAETEAEWTYRDKYENLIHDDHIFTKGFEIKSQEIIETKISDHNIISAELL